METLKELYRIGTGPSSSHTMAPKRAAEMFISQNSDAHKFRVTLYASLAATGRGHLTDKVLYDVLGDRLELVFRPDESLPNHPNGMLFEAVRSDGEIEKNWTVYSVGGGALQAEGIEYSKKDIYPFTTMSEILNHLSETGRSFWEYVFQHEDEDVKEFLGKVWLTMKDSIARGIDTNGVLPGNLNVSRKAHSLHRKMHLFGGEISQNGHLAVYAYAVAEENACGGVIVTAPTCGASGVLPSILRYIQRTVECSEEDIIQALATAGLIGNLIKENASISGAEVGCQGEIGSACAMAAAAATQLLGGSVRQIEYAAEMGLEHLLGLTCDPVDGLVQIPCIERNAHAAVRALGCAHFAILSDGVHKISFDEVTSVMMETGQAIPPMYRETSEAGLAEKYRKR